MSIIQSKTHVIIGVMIITLLFQCVFILIPKYANAETQNTAWSWTEKHPVLASSESASGMPSYICSNFYQTKEIEGYSDLQNVCMSSGDNVRFGTYYGDFSYRAAVSFKFDTKMYKINGICYQSDNCLYLPGSDTLATKQYVDNNYTRSLVVYKNFTHRLTPIIKVGLISTLEYNFDTSNPDYVSQSASGYAWPMVGFGASENGNWLAVEFRERCIGLLNIATLNMERISPLMFDYDSGIDPTPELSVSNDGDHVVVGGRNAGLTVLDISHDCSEDATDDKMQLVGYMLHPCKVAFIDTNSFIYRFRDSYHPRFNDDGGELSFYASSYLGELKYVSLLASGYVRQRIDYLALGDSFASGEGETDDNYYINGTNDEYQKCHISTRSYPFLVASLSGVNPAFMRSVACSGAVIKDVIGENESYEGQGGRLKLGGLGLMDVMSSKNLALGYFTPGIIHQQTFVEKYKPKVITIGIGGNDAGFMDKLRTCVGIGTCDSAGTDKGKEQTAIEIKNLFITLVEAYKNIHLSSPNSKIYVIGYPKIIDENGECGLFLNSLLNDSEKQFMNEGIIYLNKVIESAAKAAGMKYIDVQDSYGDNVLCGKLQPSFMNAIRLGDDTNLLNDSRWFRFVGSESFHPNSLGHSSVADSIIKSVGNIIDYEYCDNGEVVCPNQSVVAPEPSSYWLPDGYHGYPTQKNSDYISGSDGVQKHLNLEAGSLKPNSLVNVEIMSNPVSLGHFEVTSDGSLGVDVNLPIDLDEGYHTIHLYGTSNSGELIELWQLIGFKKPYTVSNDVIKPVDDQPKNVTSDSVKTIDNEAVVSVKERINESGLNNSQNQLMPIFGHQAVEGAKISTTLPLEVGRSNNIADIFIKIAVGVFCICSTIIIVTIVKKENIN